MVALPSPTIVTTPRLSTRATSGSLEDQAASSASAPTIVSSISSPGDAVPSSKRPGTMSSSSMAELAASTDETSAPASGPASAGRFECTTTSIGDCSSSVDDHGPQVGVRRVFVSQVELSTSASIAPASSASQTAGGRVART